MSVRVAASAQVDIDALETYYAERGREAAVKNLIVAVERAASMIQSSSQISLSAPGPYPDLSNLGAHWLHVGRYWISYIPELDGYVITNVIFDAANIPSRTKRNKT